jgi:uncharacterized cofD-like protein
MTPSPPQNAQTPKPVSGDNDIVWRQLLKPAIGLKRWLALLVAGILLIGMGLAVFLHDMLSAPQWSSFVSAFTLQFLPQWARVLLPLALGTLLAVVGWLRFYRILYTEVWPDLRAFENQELSAILLRRYRRSRGPRIVTIGGGTGMPQLLRGLRKYTDNITAIVTVADDGGSSGRLRRSMGILPPGDFRNNIAALSEVEGLMTRLFQYRFADRELGVPHAANELAGHSFGNLFITTIAAVTGSFEAGIAESSKVLRVRGRVLPGTLEDVTLCAEVRRLRPDGEVEMVMVEGESMLPKAQGQVERVFLKQEQIRPYPEAIRAILQADLIVAGPGSFYTSVIPNLLVPGIVDAIGASSAPSIYICNVATRAGETDHFGVCEHMAKLREHAKDAFPNVLANDSYDLAHPPAGNAQWVCLPPPGAALDFRLFTGNVVDERRPWRHDADKLATRVVEVYSELRAGLANT